MFNKIKQFFYTRGNEPQNTLLGKTLQGRYQIIANLDSGGMGETYLALDLHIPVNPKPKCVVKRIQPQMKQHPDIIRLFNKEAEILYKLGSEHPQIPTLYAYFTDNQDFYIVQEYVEGKNLSQDMGAIPYTITPPNTCVSPAAAPPNVLSKRKWTEAEVIQLLKEILEILAYVHQQGVIHRDIKPANLIRRYQDGKLILIDFGCVKEVRNQIITPSGETTLTVMVGTPGFIASEQALGQPKFSTDLYAVGMTVIQALTGIRPDTLPKDKNEIVWRDFTDVSNELSEFLTKMVRYDCYQRYQDAMEALQVLNQIRIPKVVPFELNGKYGYVSNGKLITPCDFDFADDFSEGLALVEKEGKRGYINPNGQLVIPFQFEVAHHFSEGLAGVKKEAKWGYINSSGEFVIPFQFDFAFPFSEGLAAVEKEGKCGFINSNGQVVIPFQLEGAHYFSEGLAGVVKEGKWGYINLSGQVVIPFQFDFADDFSEGLAGVVKEGKVGYINSNGQVVIAFQFERLWSFSEGLALVIKEGKCFHINSKGELIIPFPFDRTGLFSEGLAKVEKDRKSGYINPNGQLVIPFQFDYAEAFSEGLAAVQKEWKWGYINLNGQLVIPFQFDYAEAFSQGLAAVEKEKKWGYISPNGQLVIPFQFDYANDFSEGLAEVKINRKKHLIDKTGKIVY